MRVAQLSSMAIFSAVAGIVPASGQTSDLVGTWTAEITIALESEGQIVEVDRDWLVVVEEVDGSLVRGYRAWLAESDDPGYVEDEAVLTASEPFVGAVSSDGKTLHLVETNDHGLMFGELIGPEELRFPTWRSLLTPSSSPLSSREQSDRKRWRTNADAD